MPHDLLRQHQVGRRAHGDRCDLFAEGRRRQHAPLGLLVGIADVDLQQEPVELRLGQGIGAFLLQRILRRQHMERLGQVVALAGHGDVPLLHRLQQRRLRARRGAIDLIRHQKLGEHRSGDEAEAALAAGLFQHFRADDVGRHQVRRELDAFPVQPQDDAQRLDQLGLGQPGHADQKAVAAGQHRHQRLLDHRVLAEDRLADRLAHPGQRGRGALQMGGGARTLSHGIVHKGGPDAWLPVRWQHPIFDGAPGRDLCTPAVVAQQGKHPRRTGL